MAAARGKPVGSAAWIAAEKENVTHLVEQELEEVEFPVRHELDWLNEHMAEIFSNNQFNMTELLKTPGKMRGKTPRTARKRNPDESRVPLNEIFTSSNQKPKMPSKFTAALEKTATVSKPSAKPSEQLVSKPVEEQLNKEPAEAKQKTIAASGKPVQNKTENADSGVSVSKGKEPVRDQPANNNKTLNSFSTYNTDSGYHGLPDEEEDEDEVVLAATQIISDNPEPADTQAEAGPSTQPLEVDTTVKVQHRKSESVDRRTTDQSFHSAQENMRSRGETVEPMDVAEDHQEIADEDTPRPFSRSTQEQPEYPILPEKTAYNQPDLSDAQDQDEDMVLDENFDDLGSPSDNSTPARPPMRKKSSLSFASLPAREPLIKKSMSRTSHLDMVKQTGPGRQSYFGGQGEGLKPSTLGLNTETDDQRQESLDLDRKQRSLQTETDDGYGTSTSSTQRTQRLHDKISMLGKTQAPRTTKSLAPSSQGTSQVNYPDLPSNKSNTAVNESAPTAVTTSQEDWIKPLESPQKTAIPKSQTTDIMERMAGNDTVGKLEKGKLTRTETVPDLRDKRSPTPKGSVFSAFGHHKSASKSTPPARRGEQTALLASNVAVESTTPSVSPRRFDSTTSGPRSKFQSVMKTALGLFSSSAGISAAAKLETLSSPSASRSQPNLSHITSSPQRFSPSPERAPMRIQNIIEADKPERNNKPQTALEDPFEEPRVRQEKEQPSNKLDQVEKAPPREHDMRETHVVQPNATKIQKAPAPVPRDTEILNDAEHKFPLPPSTSHAAPAQPAQPAQSTKLRPVKPTREVAQKPKPQPMSIRVGSTLTRPPMASSTSYIQEPSTAPTPGSTKQPNLSKKASNSSLQTTASNASFKSSVSSQSQRKAQVAASVEKKKQEEREAALRKEEQKKRAAQQKQQQEEARRAERERSVAEDPKKAAQRQAIEQRRLENSRLRHGSQPPKLANDMGSSLHQDKTAQRADPGPARPPSRLGSTLHSFNRSINQPPTNPAKPAKRPLDEESQTRSGAPAYRPSEQPADGKRRRTEDEYSQPFNQPPPSLKQQPIRKENGKLSLMGYGYSQAPPPVASHSMYKTMPVQQGAAGRQLKHGPPIDTTQYASGTIPFAPTNPPATTVHKTPSHKTANLAAQRAPAKVSPQYPPSESIHLPEPNTDSEDEDSDADMLPVPEWAQADELQRALATQEDAPTDHIFGRIAPFMMEEVFKQDKKLKKFRERTSSANWGGPDGLTQEEISRDQAARQRLRTNGQWSYQVSR
ncbi:Serine/arginine repetitive matrix protein 2 [Talaromyces islandicus]|uniref:Serine/arginine repetitive matrix protein 2 n=1 Tax=Talaromyces islandicus TaxID=28573 RepID=A0A0U1M7F1_TALIS|nr:Serine/arginine repetitive matrix protein 2 [Talaromyces islandicus]